MPVPVDDLRIVGGDVRRLLLGVAVRRIPALCEHALDDSLGCARRITRIAHEACLGLPPLLQVALERYPGKSANVQFLVLSLDVREPRLGASFARRGHRPVILGPEPFPEPRASTATCDDRRHECP